MFEIGRGLKRLFSRDASSGLLALAGPALLEVLDLNLLRREAREADITAGRVGAKDRPRRYLEASLIWRELARRTGDAAAVRKAASAAELAFKGFAAEKREGEMTEARLEQAACAMLGADLFAEEGLDAAAEYVLAEISATSAEALGGLASIAARRAAPKGSVAEALAAAARFDRPLSVVSTMKPDAARLLRRRRAETLLSFGARLHEPSLLRMALADLDAAGEGLDPANRPLSWLAAQELRGAVLTALGETLGDAKPLVEAVEVLTQAAEHLTPDHSPLDWARLHNTLGLALSALGEAGDLDAAFDKALEQFSIAIHLLGATPDLALRTVLAQNRAACLSQRAELRGDAFALDEAEAVFRGELASLRAASDPVAWAVLQLSLARIYMARARMNGLDQGEHAKAGEALAAALDVFGETGQRTLSVIALTELNRLKTDVPKPVV
ncbi:MAG: hypothetical protein ACXW3D_04935 [Caulobacteraceae bacterium]